MMSDERPQTEPMAGPMAEPMAEQNESEDEGVERQATHTGKSLRIENPLTRLLLVANVIKSIHFIFFADQTEHRGVTLKCVFEEPYRTNSVSESSSIWVDLAGIKPSVPSTSEIECITIDD